MHLGHTRQSTFSSIDFVKNKTKRIKRKNYKPVPTTIRTVEKQKKSQDSNWIKIYLNSLLLSKKENVKT